MNPHNDPSYLRFVDDMAKKCHCRPEDRPCDGLLAGGLCDSHGGSELHHPQEWTLSDDEHEEAANNDFLT